MLAARTVVALCAACVREPALAEAVPLDGCPALAAGLLRALRADAVRFEDVDGVLVATIDGRTCADVDPDAVAAFAAWCAAAPPALADEGEALLAYRVRPPGRRPAVIEPLGALALWRQELARGVRTTGTEDALAKAARWEASALDAAREGDARGARRMIERAAALLDDRAEARAA